MNNHEHPAVGIPPVPFRSVAQQQLYRLYGDPREKGWEQKWMTVWAVRKDFTWFPKEQLYLHKDFQPLLKTAFGRLQNQGLAHEIKSCEGCFAIRNVRSAAFLSAMQQGGLYCGALFHSRKDPMHFAMVDG